MRSENIFMESFNKIIEIASDFVSVVQNECNKTRSAFEQWHSDEYNKYVLEWKQSQKLKEKALEVEINEKSSESLSEEEKEELDLADALLQKARAIRTKNKVFQSANAPAAPKSLQNNMPNMNKKKIPNKAYGDKSHEQICKTLAHSKSLALPVTNHIKEPLPRSKSDNVTQARGKSITKKPAVQSHSQMGPTSGMNQSGAITKQELVAFQRLHVDCTKTKQANCKSVPPNAVIHSEGTSFLRLDASSLQCNLNSASAESCVPTKKAFQNMLKSTAVCRDYRIHKDSLWYPFLSGRNKHLLRKIRFDSSGQIDQAYLLLHHIQETMLWLDLFSLIGKNAHLTLLGIDERDAKSILICSYLQSIFHESGQRMPIVDPNR